MAGKHIDILSDAAELLNNKDKSIAIILHTSVVMADIRCLEKFFSDVKKSRQAKVYMTDNSIYELRLLQKFGSIRVFKEKAEFLLDRCSAKNAWSFDNIVSDKKRFIKNYHADCVLFVFMQPFAAQAMFDKIGPTKDIYYLSYDPLSDYRGPAVCRASVSDRVKQPRCVPLGNQHLNGDRVIGKDDWLNVSDAFGNETIKLKGNDLKFEFCGGEATLFTCKKLPNKIIKIYKNWMPGKGMSDKLKYLMAFNVGSGVSEHCVLPEKLVYLNSQLVGYVMKREEGISLDGYLPNCSDTQRTQFIGTLLTALLELQLAQFLVTDLSLGNVIVRNDNSFRILDTDGMQIRCYSGGGGTSPFGHPEVREDCFYKKLRTLEQVNFSIAVLLFYSLSGILNPLTQVADALDEDDEFEWGRAKFPYDNNPITHGGIVATGCRVNSEYLNMWREMPYQLRKCFVDTFTFRSVADIGAFAKAFSNAFGFEIKNNKKRRKKYGSKKEPRHHNYS